MHMKRTIPPGISVPMHSHDFVEVFFVLSGNFEVIIGDGKMRWIEVSAGDLVEVPSNVKHAFRNRSQHPVIKLGVHDVQARTLLSGNRQTCGLLGQD